MGDEKLVEIVRRGTKVWQELRERLDPLELNVDPAEIAWVNVYKGALVGGDLSGARIPRAVLPGADLSQSDLRRADLREADLSRATLNHANLSRCNLGDAKLNWAELREASLRGANLTGTDLRFANLRGADLRDVELAEADLRGACLVNANLCHAYLGSATLNNADLNGADLSQALLCDTTIADVSLDNARGLDSCTHLQASFIDHLTLAKSPNLPLAFLRGCGLPDFVIDNRHVLHGDSIQFYSCFISYSSADAEFAQRLYNDLQGKGIRCWFAPEDLRTGDRFRDRINEAIRIHDKLLLVFSKNSIESDWVEAEVERGFEEERRRSKNATSSSERPTVLFPIRLDDEILRTEMRWAEHIRLTRHIGEFSDWKDHDAYQKAFERLIRDLRASEG